MGAPTVFGTAPLIVGGVRSKSTAGTASVPVHVSRDERESLKNTDVLNITLPVAVAYVPDLP